MSKMIPPFYDDSIKSNGEKKVFGLLFGLSDEYTVLHSLGIANHRSKVCGEIDFVIICRSGILCLEVKGGYVSRKDGIWQFVNRFGNITESNESPFMQVLGSMFSLRGNLIEHFGNVDLANCQLACGVVFPDQPFDKTGPDIISEIIYDARRSDSEIEEYIKKVFSFWRKRLKEKHGFEGNTLDPSQITKLVTYLRGDFGFVPSLNYIIQRTEEKLLKLTEEQSQRLSMASENPRILLKGVAGTGKTLLSMEHAKRMAVTGETVLYLCYNTNLAKHLRYGLEKSNTELGKKIILKTFHAYIIDELTKRNCLPNEELYDPRTYYNEVLPQTFFDMVTKENDFTKYDCIVLDEGQDLITSELLMCLDAVILGGLKKGKWQICFDPNQNIYNRNIEDGLDLLYEFSHTVLTLDTNCRNTRPIGVYTTLYSGIKPAKYFRVEGEAIGKESYINEDDQRKKLLKKVKNLIGQGINPGQIWLLSMRTFENSCLKGQNIFLNVCSFQNASNISPKLLDEKSIKFSTVHSFKGLEASIVILLDVESFCGPTQQLLNYTAMSRAKTYLYVLYNQSSEQDLQKMISDSAYLLKVIKE